MVWAYPSDRSEAELAINIRKATNTDETAPKRKHVRACIVYTWDHKSSQSFWAGMKVYVDMVLWDNPVREGLLISCVMLDNQFLPMRCKRSRP